MKICPQCKIEKPIDEFYIRKGSGRHSSYCRVCSSKRGKDYYVKNKARCKELAKAYYENNIDKMRLYKKKWAEENKDRRRELWMEYHWRNPHKTYARQALYYEVKCGRIKRPLHCSECGCSSLKIEGHHDDYSKPLDVRWLCRDCHLTFHKKANA